MTCTCGATIHNWPDWLTAACRVQCQDCFNANCMRGTSSGNTVTKTCTGCGRGYREKRIVQLQGTPNQCPQCRKKNRRNEDDNEN